MEEKQQNSSGFLIGDKVRIRSGVHMGARGVILAELDGIFQVQLEQSNVVNIPTKEVTNYSLAARRAWQVMPKQSGRPQLSAPRKKMVSMRLDVDVWNRLGEAVELGLIPSREEAVNTWLCQHLKVLFEESSLLNQINKDDD